MRWGRWTQEWISSVLVVAGAVTIHSPSLADGPWESEHVSGEVVLQLDPGANIDDVLDRWGLLLLDSYVSADLYLVEADETSVIPELAEQLETDPDVQNAEPNFVEDTPEGIRQLVIVAVGGELVDYEDQEIGVRIGLDEAHQQSLGQGVTVAVLDTGVDPNHEALVGHLSPHGYDFVDDDTTPWEVANGVDDDADGEVDEGYGHGTMVAGIVALVAPDATILPLRVLDDDARAESFAICKALRYAQEQGADVINMSFGVPAETEAITAQAEILEEDGILLVSGAGNQSSDEEPFFPAAHETVIMVTAVDSFDVKADFADWGEWIEVCAPGAGVRSSYPDGQWGLGAGCSFATPFVSGAAALAKAFDPTGSVEALYDRTVSAAEPIDQLPGNEAYAGDLGSGRIYLPLLFLETTSVPVGLASLEIRIAPNPSTDWVAFESAVPDGDMSVRVFDARGRMVQRLEGPSPMRWSLVDAAGRPVPAGVYFAKPENSNRSTPFRVIR